MIQLELADFPAEGIAVDAEQLGGAALIAFGALKGALDEALLEFVKGFVQQNAVFDHLSHEGFDLVFHGGTLRRMTP
jgi:hypothetical protein